MKYLKEKCLMCGTEFEYPYKSGRVRKFCSRVCNGAYRKKVGSAELLCIQCNKQFTRWKSNVREMNFCSHECHDIYRTQHSKQRIKVICDWCGKKIAKRNNRITRKNYCTNHCKFIASQKRIPLNCEFCGNEIFRRPSQIKKSIFCSKACKNKFYVRINNDPRVLAFRKLRRELELKKGYRKDTYSLYYGRQEHRVVAEQKLGRSLDSNEVVHHNDHNKRNNSPENLTVMTRSEHGKIHRTKKEFDDDFKTQ